MEHKFTIVGNYAGNYCFPSLNQYLQEYGRSPHCANSYKKKYKMIVINAFRRDLKRYKATSPVIVHYHIYEPKKYRKRDVGNVVSCCDKFVLDALQDCGCLQGDDPRYVVDFDHKIFYTDGQPKIEIILEEKEINK